jgi:hypothetical protein
VTKPNKRPHSSTTKHKRILQEIEGFFKGNLKKQRKIPNCLQFIPPIHGHKNGKTPQPDGWGVITV